MDELGHLLACIIRGGLVAGAVALACAILVGIGFGIWVGVMNA